MKLTPITATLMFSLLLQICNGQNKTHQSTYLKQHIALAAVKGKKSKTRVITVKNKQNTPVTTAVKGEHANFWHISSSKLSKSNQIEVYFQPDSNFIGRTADTLMINTAHDTQMLYVLKGLSMKGIEGKNEPPLVDVTATLGYAINVGWTTLSNHVKPELQGDEISAQLFKRAKRGPVHMIPVARYSPKFPLPFGYYTHKNDSIEKHEVGVLIKDSNFHEHQTIYPKMLGDQTSFNPGKNTFGFYTTSPSHDAFSEDKWNALYFKKHAKHATRIYPLKNELGQLIKYQYLVCFEEAKNGDYQDYVFVVKNIEPISLNH